MRDNVAYGGAVNDLSAAAAFISTRPAEDQRPDNGMAIPNHHFSRMCTPML
jgi:hypothetical protein